MPRDDAAEDAVPLDELLAERRRLLNLAFRMLGSASDAEDALQEAYIRWYRLSDEERRAVRSPAAWLTTVVSRICLNVLDSARHRRERYVGEWLPEPLPGADTPLTDPAERVTLDESVQMALLVVLESLTPAERVAFVLHDVFALPFDEIAAVVGRSSEATRRLASSARKHIAERRAGAADRSEHTALVRAFRAACEGGDLQELTRLLDPAVTATSDGGGRIRAALRPVHGADRVGRFLLGALSKRPDLRIEERQVNGETGLVLSLDGAVFGVLALGVRAGRITDVWLVVNPDKLRPWAAGTA